MNFLSFMLSLAGNFYEIFMLGGLILMYGTGPGNSIFSDFNLVNPFSSMCADLGISYTTFIPVTSFSGEISNILDSVSVGVVGDVINNFYNNDVSPMIILLTYALIVGGFMISIKIISKLCRYIKDIVNPLN